MEIKNVLVNKKIIILIILFTLISLSGAFTIVKSTLNFGLGTTPDSAAYIAGAKNIINGNGIVVLYNDKEKNEPLKLWASKKNNSDYLIFHWPPFYPIVLALVALLKINIFSGAIFLNAIFFGLNIIILCCLVYKTTNSSITAVITGLFFSYSKVILTTHTFLMSEPLFFLLGFSGLLISIFFLEYKKYYLIIIASFLFGLSAITRYIGISFTITFILIIIIFIKEKLRQKIFYIFTTLLISFAPISFWFYRTLKIGSNITDRTFSYHPPTFEALSNIPTVINNWFFIKKFQGSLNFFNYIIFFFIFLILMLLTFLIYKRMKNKLFLITNVYFYLFIFVYMFLLIASRTFFDAKIPIDQDRLLSPVFISFIILISNNIFFFIKEYFKKNKKIFLSIVVILLAVSFVFFNVYKNYFYLKDIYENGQGYSTKKLLNSKLIAQINNIPKDKILYSDATDLIYILTKRQSFVFPVYYDPYDERENYNFNQQLEEMFKNIYDNKGYLIDFYYLERPFLPTISELKIKENLCLYYKNQEGEIYQTCPKNLTKIFLSDNTNFENFWREMNQCSFEKNTDSVIIKSFGDDPWFESKFKFNFNSNLILKITLFTDTTGDVRIFFGLGDKEYVLDDSESYPLKNGLNTICFMIPDFYNYYDKMEKISKIRIDPIDKKADIEIKKIELLKVN